MIASIRTPTARLAEVQCDAGSVGDPWPCSGFAVALSSADSTKTQLKGLFV